MWYVVERLDLLRVEHKMDVTDELQHAKRQKVEKDELMELIKSLDKKPKPARPSKPAPKKGPQYKGDAVFPGKPGSDNESEGGSATAWASHRKDDVMMDADVDSA